MEVEEVEEEEKASCAGDSQTVDAGGSCPKAAQATH